MEESRLHVSCSDLLDAMAQAVSRQLPTGFDPRLGRVGFVVDKVTLGWIFSSTSVSLFSSRSTNCSVLVNYAIINAIYSQYK
jgi:hypothetical protein